MKKLTIGLLIGACAVSSFSSHAGIIEDVKDQAEAVGKKVVQKGQEGLEQIEALAFEKLIILAVENSDSYERALKNPSLINTSLVELEIVNSGRKLCINKSKNLPYRTSTKACLNGTVQARKKLFEKLNQAKK